MSLPSRGTRAAARPLRQLTHRQPRRSASDHAHHDSHSSGESALHVQGGSSTGSESFGKGFYIALTAIPFAYIAYSVSFSEDNFIRKRYKQYHEDLKAQDVLHAAALEQAISDRGNMNAQPRSTVRDLRYTEFFNHGSPINVAAGQGTADMKKLEEFYHEKRKAYEAERDAKLAAK